MYVVLWTSGLSMPSPRQGQGTCFACLTWFHDILHQDIMHSEHTRRSHPFLRFGNGRSAWCTQCHNLDNFVRSVANMRTRHTHLLPGREAVRGTWNHCRGSDRIVQAMGVIAPGAPICFLIWLAPRMTVPSPPCYAVKIKSCKKT